MLDLVELGGQQLKGIAGATAAFAVLGERKAASRFDARTSSLSAMIGRDHELGLILERWQQAKAGDGQFVLLSGEPGIGKSRVIRALFDTLVDDPHHRISHQCSPYYSDSALYPVVQGLLFAAGIGSGDSNEQKLDRLEAIVAGSEARRLIAALLGIDPELRWGRLEMTAEQQRALTLRALVAELMTLAQDRPVLWVIEDLHWIDATTLELIDLCLDQVAGSRVMILATARPTFQHGFGGHPIVTRFSLNRLGRDQIRSIVERLTGGKGLPDALVQEIAIRTDGVPLFIEELTKAILESGHLTETASGFELDRPLDRLAIPATLHDSLMARLDRLQPVKEVAQTAACIGREFGFPLLHAISPLGSSELEHALTRLTEAELIFRRHHDGEAIFVFKHALVRDAAYESLLRAKRQTIHARLVEALEAREDTAPELLAHHAAIAGLTEKAIEYWQQAGVLALARPAYQEAIGHLRNALALVVTMGGGRIWLERELDLQVLLAQALIPKLGWSAGATAQAYARGLDLVEQLGSTPNQFPVLFGIWVGHLVRGETADLVAHAQSILALAEQNGGEIPRLMARRFNGVSQMMAGNFRAAQLDLDFVLSAYRSDRHRELAQRFGQDPGAQTLGYICILYWVLGLLDQSARCAEAAEIAADVSAHVTTTCDVSNLSTYAMCTRDNQRLERPIQNLQTLSALHNLPVFRTVSDCVEGILLSKRGDQAGTARFQNACTSLLASGVRIYMPLFVIEHAQTLIGLGRFVEARIQVDLALELLVATGECWAAAEIHRVDGELCLAEGQRSAAEARFQHAVEIARQQEAKSWELRATMSVARLWAESGERGRARESLAPVLDRFTEGFETVDLQEAAQLLGQLER